MGRDWSVHTRTHAAAVAAAAAAADDSLPDQELDNGIGKIGNLRGQLYATENACTP